MNFFFQETSCSLLLGSWTAEIPMIRVHFKHLIFPLADNKEKNNNILFSKLSIVLFYCVSNKKIINKNFRMKRMLLFFSLLPARGKIKYLKCTRIIGISAVHDPRSKLQDVS